MSKLFHNIVESLRCSGMYGPVQVSLEKALGQTDEGRMLFSLFEQRSNDMLTFVEFADAFTDLYMRSLAEDVPPAQTQDTQPPIALYGATKEQN